MPVQSIGGKTAVDAGAFVIPQGASQAVFGAAGYPIALRFTTDPSQPANIALNKLPSGGPVLDGINIDGHAYFDFALQQPGLSIIGAVSIATIGQGASRAYQVVYSLWHDQA